MDVFTDNILRQLAAKVNSEFRRNLPKIRVIEIIYTWGRTFYLVIPDHINIFGMRTKLPGMIAGCPVGYINDKELHRPKWAELQAKREIEPSPARQVIDTTAYDTLRPGVLVCSKCSRTTGIPIRG